MYRVIWVVSFSIQKIYLGGHYKRSNCPEMVVTIIEKLHCNCPELFIWVVIIDWTFILGLLL